jgi:hypothetical protein
MVPGARLWPTPRVDDDGKIRAQSAAKSFLFLRRFSAISIFES